MTPAGNRIKFTKKICIADSKYQISSEFILYFCRWNKMGNVLIRVRATTVAVEKQYLLHILGVCLYP